MPLPSFSVMDASNSNIKQNVGKVLTELERLRGGSNSIMEGLEKFLERGVQVGCGGRQGVTRCSWVRVCEEESMYKQRHGEDAPSGGPLSSKLSDS